MEATRERVIAEAKRIEEDALYSSRGHYKENLKWSRIHLWLGIPATITAGLVGVSFLSNIDRTGFVTAGLSFTVAILTALTTFLNANQKACVHLEAGNRFNHVRRRARILYQLDILTADDAAAIKALKLLSDEYADTCQKTPQIPAWAYKKAKREIEVGQADYKVDRDS